IVFNHAQTAFVDKYIEGCCEPYVSRDCLKVVVADDCGLSNKPLVRKHKNRSDILFLSRDPTPKMPGHIQQIDSLYYALSYIKKSTKLENAMIHLLDGDDFYAKGFTLVSPKFIGKFRINFRHEIQISDDFQTKDKDVVCKDVVIKLRPHQLWPNILPTSGLSVSYEFLEKFRHIIQNKRLGTTWLDTRINLILFRLNKNQEISHKDATGFYRVFHGQNASMQPSWERLKMYISSFRFQCYIFYQIRELRRKK
ncbi:hypothetical protein N9F07_04060, partial [Octadecabacter sp.]|nr:hypothetical protein [Octadecabacter sp.]